MQCFYRLYVSLTLLPNITVSVIAKAELTLTTLHSAPVQCVHTAHHAVWIGVLDSQQSGCTAY